jgi:transcription antitermination protein NusB
MPARSKARKRALDVLFEAEQRRLDPLALLDERQAAADPPVPGYAADLVRGVVANRERLDELISTYTQSWPLERMPAVDRAVLRLGAYELLFVDEVPDAVALSEAVLLARRLSTDESPQFVNGLLARLMSLKPTLSL